MGARELRIGNIIEQIHDVLGRSIIRVSIEELENILNPNECIEYYGMPLTEEWLLKFGFDKDRHYYHITLLTGLTLFYSSEYKKFWFDVKLKTSINSKTFTPH